jgi:plastocyanin
MLLLLACCCFAACSKGTDAGKMFVPGRGHPVEWASHLAIGTNDFHGTFITTAPPGTTGGVLFVLHCAPCHGNDGAGKIGLNIQAATLSLINYAFATFPVMAGHAGLTQAQRQSIADYIATLTSTTPLAGTIDPTPCQQCHGENLDGGIAQVSCYSCHDGPYGGLGHPAGWLSGTNNLLSFHGPYGLDFSSGCTTCQGVDLNGGYVFSSPTGSAPGCPSCHPIGVPPSPPPVVVTYSITGNITSQTVPLAGVTVGLAGSPTLTVTTGASGNYTFSGLANGQTYTITPSKAGYIMSPLSSSATVSAANITGVDFAGTASPGYSISGQVTSNSVGLAAVTMTLSGDIVLTTSTDGSGTYTFGSLANGQTYIITPSMTNFSFSPKSSSPQTISSADITGVNFKVLVQQDPGCVTLVSTQTVTIASFAFSPNNVVLSGAGDVVKWHNGETSTTHTVTSGIPGTPDGTFNSGNLTAGSDYCVKFIDPTHTYKYFCSIHTFMTGTINVP